MSTPQQSKPRVFVSYSHKDGDFTRRLVDRLHAAGAEVWVDVAGIDHGNFMQRIDEALESCEWMVLVLTPDAIASQYVKDEVYTALHRVKQGYMRDVIPLLAAACAPRSIPPQWDTLQRYDATGDYDAALAGLMRALGLVSESAAHPAPPHAAPPPTSSAGDAAPPASTVIPAHLEPNPNMAPPSAMSPSADQPAGNPHPGRPASVSRRQVLVSSSVTAGLAVIGGAVWLTHLGHSTPTTPPAATSTPLVALPARMTSLGFILHTKGSTTYIVPPVRSVPAGEFLMGSDPTKDSQAQGNEQPKNLLILGAFQIATHPVTVLEYATFIQATRHSVPSDWTTQQLGTDHPVGSVSWIDAGAYAAWLAQMTSQAWRLPTEAEWEKAARGTDGRIYPWGDTFDQARCNTSGSGINTTTSVGTYPGGASPYGVQDMAGNVENWTSSLDQPYPYIAQDGRERADSPGYRVVRGGSWGLGSSSARAASRFGTDPGNGYTAVGFRIALTAPGS